MQKDYLIRDFLVPPTMWVEGKLVAVPTADVRELKRLWQTKVIPKIDATNRVIVRIDRYTSLRTAFLSKRHAVFCVRSTSRRRAYEVATSVVGYFALIWGRGVDYDRYSWLVHESVGEPTTDSTDEDLLRGLRSADPEAGPSDVHALHSGVQVEPEALAQLAVFVQLAHDSRNVRDALMHFGQSRFLFDGYMTGSYYHAHYSRDRKYGPKQYLEKRYFENRARFELAFLAAFKSIEALFGVNDFKAAEIPKVLANVGVPSLEADRVYIRYHETFSRLKKRVTYRELLGRFLRIRNVVGAHANCRPPKDFIVSEDSLYEIQRFASILIMDTLDAKGLPELTR